MIGTVQHCDWHELARLVGASGGCDALICDPPYSERTHEAQRSGKHLDGSSATELGYDSLSAEDCRLFADSWSHVVRGWVVVMCDHGLAPAWVTAWERAGRYVFSPLAYVVRGSRVRLAGDGPAQWSVWIVVARPRREPYSRWGSLPGAYVQPHGFDDRAGGRGGSEGPIRGSKSRWIMERLIEDYSRRGDTIVDPCCGTGTTLIAAETTRRRWIGGDADEAHVTFARARMARGIQVGLSF